MAIYCFECGVEVPEEKKVLRLGRTFCSAQHARTKRQVAAPPQVKSTAQPTSQAAPAQAPGVQPASGEKPAAALAAAPAKPPQA
jgi:hypothetical protein